MTAVTRFFFRPPHAAHSAWSIVYWWEGRRVVYNAAVGAAGALSLATVALFQALPPNGHPVPGIPWSGVLAYGVLANVCYSFGPLVDVAIRRLWGRDYDAIGPTLFRYGFVFSIGVSLLPIPLTVIGWVARLLGF